MTTTITTDAVPSGPPAPLTVRAVGAAGRAAFVGLLARDLTVLRKNLKEFLPRTLLQPFLLMFVFTYVFPKIGQGVGGGASAGPAGFATDLVAGVVGLAILFQGVQAVALPLVQEFGFTKEIEDRVMAPLAVPLVAGEKIVAGALQGVFAASLVFPLAAVVPATDVNLAVHWPLLITLGPLACLTSAALGLTFGTIFEPRSVPVLFGVVILPLTFLGCTYYSWSSLDAIRWLQVFVLINPLVYISEGFRAALTKSDHMPLVAIYGAQVAFLVAFTLIGIKGFLRRVLS
jgi:ABC-2 type transport system permease protein